MLELVIYVFKAFYLFIYLFDHVTQLHLNSIQI